MTEKNEKAANQNSIKHNSTKHNPKMIKSVEDAREFFKADIYAVDTTGIYIEEADLGYSKVSLKLDERHLNAAGNIMGGVYYTMADFAFGVAVNFDKPYTVTWDSQINFFMPSKGDTLYAEAHMIKDGSRMCSCEVWVTDNLGNKIAFSVINGCRL